MQLFSCIFERAALLPCFASYLEVGGTKKKGEKNVVFFLVQFSSLATMQNYYLMCTLRLCRYCSVRLLYYSSSFLF